MYYNTSTVLFCIHQCVVVVFLPISHHFWIACVAFEKFSVALEHISCFISCTKCFPPIPHAHPAEPYRQAPPSLSQGAFKCPRSRRARKTQQRRHYKKTERDEGKAAASAPSQHLLTRNGQTSEMQVQPESCANS